MFDFSQLVQNPQVLVALVVMWGVGVFLKNRVEAFDHERWMWAAQVGMGLIMTYFKDPANFDLNSVFPALGLAAAAMGGHSLAQGVSRAGAGGAPAESGRARIGFVTFIAGVLISATVGCSMIGLAGRAAREQVTVPAIAQAWPSVEADVLRGLSDATEDGDMTDGERLDEVSRTAEWDAAVAEGSRTELVVLRAQDWTRFRMFAERGIADRLADGEVGVGVAASLSETVEEFEQALGALAGEPTDPDAK